MRINLHLFYKIVKENDYFDFIINFKFNPLHCGLFNFISLNLITIWKQIICHGFTKISILYCLNNFIIIDLNFEKSGIYYSPTHPNSYMNF